MYILTQVLETSLLNLTKKHLNALVQTYFDSLTLAPNIHHYCDLVKTAEAQFKSLHQDTLRAILESMDTSYRNSPERLKIAVVKDTRERTLWTRFGPLTYKRTIYQRKCDKHCFCYLDEYLGLPKYIKFDPMIRSMVLEAASQSNSLIKVGKAIGQQCFETFGQTQASPISRQSIRNILNHSEVNIPPIPAAHTPSTLFVMADEKFIGRQGTKGKKQMIKLAVAFETRDLSNPKRPTLTGKHHFASSSNRFWEDFYDSLSAKYDMEKVQTIHLLGDGATWIKSGLSILQSRKDQIVDFSLDHFHYKQALRRFTRDDILLSTMDGWFRTHLSHQIKTQLIALQNETLTSSQTRSLTYLINHISDIKRMLQNPHIACSMEAKISHELASIFTSVPKGYSSSMLNKLIQLRLAHRNGHSLQSLYFQSFHPNPSSTQFDYSIFDLRKYKGSALADPQMAAYFAANVFTHF